MLPLTLLRHRGFLPLCAPAAAPPRYFTRWSALAKGTTLKHTNALGATTNVSSRFLTTATVASGTSNTASVLSPSLDMPMSVSQLCAACDEHLKKTLSAKRQQLDAMERVKAECDEIACRYPDAFMRQLFVFLVLQVAVLFDWTYIHFDWSFVEPITYLLGYSATWIAIAWYGAMQHEFGYDALRRFLQSAKSERLYKDRQFDLQAYEALRVEVAQLDQLVHSLENLEVSSKV
ncbi:hypothetical protein JKF63_05009 [Porcisia hertigi]|uniref:Calcium uniporter protein C-terminal domain-containing protein n=1 Tax=Porcisia hertigi TaxID=2761500 RepID=A0A836IA48_9TRYP|nr:hypothetical protein JKF63_05009 [Porcisia hertigi]